MIFLRNQLKSRTSFGFAEILRQIGFFIGAFKSFHHFFKALGRTLGCRFLKVVCFVKFFRTSSSTKQCWKLSLRWAFWRSLSKWSRRSRHQDVQVFSVWYRSNKRIPSCQILTFVAMCYLFTGCLAKRSWKFFVLREFSHFYLFIAKMYPKTQVNRREIEISICLKMCCFFLTVGFSLTGFWRINLKIEFFIAYF